MNIKVFGELLFEKNQNDPLLDHIIICIYGLLKEHITTLVSTNINQKNIYNDIKTLIFECVKKRYLNLENPSNIMRKNICDCISILIISGITCSWTTSIEDLIKEANSENQELTYIALRSIADCDLIMNFYESENDDNYWDDNLNFHNKQKNEIKNKLIENSELVFSFINNVYTNINKFEKNLKNRIIKSIIDLITFWTQLNLNILKNQNIYTIILELINVTEEEDDRIENLKSFAELISKSIITSRNCKLYEFYEKVDENTTDNDILQRISENIDIEEKRGIDQYLDYVLDKFDEYNRTKKKNENMLWVYGKIFSSILENYIYFFFDFNNQRNKKVFEWLQFFISYKKRKISWMFFNCIESMMYFITDYYRFYDYNINQKKEFSNYLMSLLFNVMENCAYKKLNQNDYSQLQKSILYRNNESNWTMKDKNELYNNMNDDLDYDDIDIKEYRNSAEYVFYSIYIIFKDGLNKDFEMLFINQIISLINLNGEKTQNSSDDNNTIKLDIILLVLKSIVKGIDIECSIDIIKIINNFIYYLSNSSYITNISIFIDYLLLINQFNNLLLIDNTYFEKAILLLLLVSDKNDINQCLVDSCYQVLENICSELKEKINFEKIFNVFLERFIKIYNKYEINNITPLENLIRSMLYIMGLNEDNDSENKELSDKLYPYINKILEIIINDLHKSLKQQNNNNIKLKSGIIKSFLLYKDIFYQIYSSNPLLRKKIMNDFIPNSINDLITIFNLFPNDMDIFKPIIDFYINNSRIIGEDCINSFSLINNIFIQLLKSNPNYYQIIDFLGILYKYILSHINNKNEKNYTEENKYILDKFFTLISCSIQYIKAETSFNSTFVEKIKLITNTINDVFPCLFIPIENNQINKDIIQEIIKILDFLINNINILVKEKNDLISDNLISTVIKSVSILLNEKILSNFMISLSNNQCEELIIQIVGNSWKLLEINKFNFLSNQELSQLYSQIIKFNLGVFNTVFKQCILSTKIFNDTYINNICNYISFYYNDKDKINNFFNNVLSIVYDKKEPDSLEFYFNQLNRKRNA